MFSLKLIICLSTLTLIVLINHSATALANGKTLKSNSSIFLSY